MKNVKLLSDIISDNEELVNVFYCGDYWNTYQIIVEKGTDLEKTDLGAWLEYTLHRMLDNGFKNVDIKYNSGFFKEEALNGLEIIDDYYFIDLGYICDAIVNICK